jgi:hypothetical protein
LLSQKRQVKKNLNPESLWLEDQEKHSTAFAQLLALVEIHLQSQIRSAAVLRTMSSQQTPQDELTSPKSMPKPQSNNASNRTSGRYLSLVLGVVLISWGINHSELWLASLASVLGAAALFLFTVSFED